MKAKLKKNPTRIVISKYGNGLMLLMEYAARSSSVILGKVQEVDNVFEIEVNKTLPQGVKKYINDNL